MLKSSYPSRMEQPFLPTSSFSLSENELDVIYFNLGPSSKIKVFPRHIFRFLNMVTDLFSWRPGRVANLPNSPLDSRGLLSYSCRCKIITTRSALLLFLMKTISVVGYTFHFLFLLRKVVVMIFAVSSQEMHTYFTSLKIVTQVNPSEYIHLNKKLY